MYRAEKEKGLETETRMDESRKEKSRVIEEQRETDCLTKAAYMATKRVRMRREKEEINLTEKYQRETKTKRREHMDQEK